MSRQYLFEGASEVENIEEQFYTCNDESSFEDISNEIDIVRRYYRRIYGTNDTNDNSAASMQKPVKSKSVQTDPDVSGLPQSWIVTGQCLVDELYTGLGNALNSFYHPPCKKEKQRVGSPGAFLSQGTSKFAYENGYWKSKLMPEIKLAGMDDADRQLQIAHCESFKKDLKSVMTVATKLRNLISYLEYFDCEAGSGTSNQVTRQDKRQPTEIDKVCEARYQDTQLFNQGVQSRSAAGKCEKAVRGWTCFHCGNFQKILSDKYAMVRSDVPDTRSDVNMSSTSAEIPDIAEEFEENNMFENVKWRSTGFGRALKGRTLKKADQISESIEIPDVKAYEIEKNTDFGIGALSFKGSNNDLNSLENKTNTYSHIQTSIFKRINERWKANSEHKVYGESSKCPSNQGTVRTHSQTVKAAVNKKMDPTSNLMKSVAGSSTSARGKENPCHSSERPLNQSNVGSSGNSSKNFIKRNILATKVISNRHGANMKSGEESCSGSGDIRQQKGTVTNL